MAKRTHRRSATRGDTGSFRSAAPSDNQPRLSDTQSFGVTCAVQLGTTPRSPHSIVQPVRGHRAARISSASAQVSPPPLGRPRGCPGQQAAAPVQRERCRAAESQVTSNPDKVPTIRSTRHNDAAALAPAETRTASKRPPALPRAPKRPRPVKVNNAAATASAVKLVPVSGHRNSVNSGARCSSTANSNSRQTKQGQSSKRGNAAPCRNIKATAVSARYGRDRTASASGSAAATPVTKHRAVSLPVASAVFAESAQASPGQEHAEPLWLQESSDDLAALVQQRKRQCAAARQVISSNLAPEDDLWLFGSGREL